MSVIVAAVCDADRRLVEARTARNAATVTTGTAATLTAAAEPPCATCGRAAHQPRERLVPCTQCRSLTASPHALCPAHEGGTR